MIRDCSRPAWRRAGGWLLDLALPAACSGCGREGAALCNACLPALAARSSVPRGIPLGLPSDVPEPLLQLEWCAPFSGTVRRALHDLKYAGERRLAEPLGRAVAERWRATAAGGDLVAHVPVHVARARDRGYDQAEALAIVVARTLRLPRVAALERARSTVAQFELGRDRRAANVAGAFRLAGRIDRRAIEGRWIVLVDDVVTTGATLAACAEALFAAGALGVSGLAVARER
ncbi:MAG: ComF family protein [Chloroflexi bacterium]|nr:MAG: ComF family protein [Chloroflexota bacterium]